MFPSLQQLPQYRQAIDSRKLEPGLRHYNASIAAYNGGHVLAYRHDDARGRSRVLLQRLGKKLQPLAQVHSPLAPAEGAPANLEHEDPRLFVAGGRLYLAYVALNGRHRDGLFTQELALLDDDLGVARTFDLRLGKNGERNEKNWIFFDAGSQAIGIVYSLKPHRVFIISAEDGRLLEQHETPGIGQWHFGTLSGGTPAVRLGDDYIHFFHSYIPHDRRQRRYSMSAAVFRGKAPYDCLLVSAKPLVWASDEDPAIVNPRRPGWNPLCLFPSGIVCQDDLPAEPSYLVSCGVNDTGIALLDLFRGDLDLVAPAQVATTLAVNPLAPAAQGFIRVKVAAKANGRPRTILEPGGPYRTGDVFATTPERAAALGALVAVIA